MRKLSTITLIVLLFACGNERKSEIVFEAFTEPFFDWYSLKLYADGHYDLHIPAMDYHGTYTVSGDTIMLKSLKSEPGTITTTIVGKEIKRVMHEQQWTFLIDRKTNRVRTIGPDNEKDVWIDIVSNKL